MTGILRYLLIICAGLMLSRHRKIPSWLKKRTAVLQTSSLFFLLGLMGYKIGSDQGIISAFPRIGMQAFIISFLSIVFSIIFTRFFCSRGRDKK